MRIGLVTDFYYPWIAGPSAAIRNLALGLATRGHSVNLLAPSAAGPAGRESDGHIMVTRATTLPVPFGFELRVAARPQRDVRGWLDAVQPDVVHVHHPFPLSAAAVFAARRDGIPAIMTNHTIPECSLWGIRRVAPAYVLASAAFSWWLRTLLTRCRAVATPTRTAARALHELGYRKDVSIISNGVDVDAFRPGPPDDALRQRLGLDDRPSVLYAGRLDAEKQMDVWLRAAAALSADVQLVVGGRGAERARLETLAAELGLAGRVRFIGYVSPAELPALYRLATAYFITSPVELQSITTLEAVASGLPVVAVDAGALPELVRHGENGFLVAREDAAGAARALDEIITDGGLRTRMGERSRQMALAHDLKRSVAAYEDLLRSVVEPSGTRTGRWRAAARY